ncbi:MAG: hypothetical protein PWR18_1041 [Synergistales bacterium]|nr:hypothetical protein [Synergistales bacterium]
MRPVKKAVVISLVLGVISTFCLPASAQDVQLPPVNLGQSGFLDGVAGPGWLFETTLELFSSSEFTGPSGDAVPGDNRIDTWVTMLHLARVTEQRVLGGFYGAEILVPVVGIDIRTPGGTDDKTGIGDITISPFLVQWTDGRLFGKPFFARLNFPVTLPTGDYDQARSANTGSHLFRFNPYFAFTVFLTPKLEFSSRIHYLWNGKNDSAPFSFGAESIEPGDAFHLNFSLSYETSPGTRVGVAGYYLEQTTDDRVDGVPVSGSREKVFGIGPGIMFANDRSTFFLNYYFESGAENRPEGDRLVLRYMTVF